MSLVSRIVSLAEGIAADIKALALGKVDVVAGLGLSANSYTSPEKSKLAALPPQALVSMARAATLDIGTADAQVIQVTGTAGTISSFGTAPIGVRRLIITAGALKTFAHSASLILPGAANLGAQAGTALEAVSLGDGVWRVTSVTLPSGTAVVGTPWAGGTLTKAIGDAPRGSIAVAATTDIGSIDRNTVVLTGGPGNITSFGSSPEGTWRRLWCQSTDTVIKTGGDISTPSSQDLQLSYGDVLEVYSLGPSSGWICLNYQSNGGLLSGSYARIGSLPAGTRQAIMELAGNTSGNPRNAPLKLNQGVNMATPENGAFEFDGEHLYFTIGGVRKTLA
ncbi:hypothetical protein [Pseudomonas asplenii]|uniref:Uncharacterized protein n=1 Tax=Pseudomonas asplenii TaxID=53407 RepID=A0A1H6NN18_9PSED|nr:hypothetical protein [Pseudomonas fuscovaginae]SEI17280.1 hypothetical protein SAMN05216581_3344 [Pseudomonas fuscovaginae]